MSENSGDLATILRRIEELETQAAFRDELQGRLNEVVARQDREILRLNSQVAELARRLLDLGEDLPAATPSDESEVPPHY